MAFNFGNTDTTRQTQQGDDGKYDPGKTESAFLQFKPEGDRIVRILDSELYSFWRYFLYVNVKNQPAQRSLVVGNQKQPNYSNPIRTKMDEIGRGNKGYVSPSQRFVLNVLDRTPVKKNQYGKIYYPDTKGNFPTVCEYTQESLVSQVPAPANVVKIWEFGSQVKTVLAGLHLRIRNNSTNQLMAINEFDIVISTFHSTDGKRITNVYPGASQDLLGEELLALPVYDLEAMYTPLTHTAQERILANEDYNTVLREEMNWTPGLYPTKNQDLF